MRSEVPKVRLHSLMDIARRLLELHAPSLGVALRACPLQLLLDTVQHLFVLGRFQPFQPHN